MAEMRRDILRLCVWVRLRAECIHVDSTELAIRDQRESRAVPRVGQGQRVLAIRLTPLPLTRIHESLGQLDARMATDVYQMLAARAKNADYMDFEFAMEFLDTWLDMARGRK